jgi:hypothetical protein
MWLDQICINQTDIEERNTQVLLMKDVYSHAQSTYIWLGEAGEDTEAAFDLIKGYLVANREGLRASISKFRDYGDRYLKSERKMSKLFPDELADYLESEDLWLIRVQLDNEKGVQTILQDEGLWPACQWIKSAWSAPNYFNPWNGIEDFLGRPWWSRCWVFQEAAASKHILVCCGPHQVSWDDLVLLSHPMKFSLETMTVKSFPDPVRSNIESWLALEMIAMARRKSSPAQLVTWLMMTRQCRASDPRDQVYALLGFLTKQQKTMYGIQPDYAKASTMQDVYVATAKALLINEKHWSTFAAVSGNELNEGLPSWAPDWGILGGHAGRVPLSAELNMTPGWSRRTETRSEMKRTFLAGGNLYCSPEFFENDRVIRVRGFVLGVIECIGQVDERRSQDPRDIWMSWIRLMQRKNGEYTGLTHWAKFHRTVHLDRWRKEDLPNPDGDLEVFKDRWNANFRDIAVVGKKNRGSANKRFFFFGNGIMGLAPPKAQAGDSVGILLGGVTPILLRAVKGNNTHANFIGECFVLDFMEGEIIDAWKAGKAEFVEFYLE